MADFLSRLAERSLGTASLARPVIAPLFATGPELDAAADTPEDGPRDVPDALARTARDTGPKDAMQEGAILPGSIARELEERPARRPVARPSEPAEAGDSGALAAARTAGPPPLTVERRSMRPAALRSTPGPRAQVSAADAVRPRRRVAPLPPATEPPAPIVRISIARVDVRAVAPPLVAPRPAPVRKDDRLPLGDYLRSGKRGR